jgi:alkyl sulfatase BDS1-like metallo-beta-lactamase superfamily hydrolase
MPLIIKIEKTSKNMVKKKVEMILPGQWMTPTSQNGVVNGWSMSFVTLDGGDALAEMLFT